jgi:hypothetical protein
MRTTVKISCLTDLFGPYEQNSGRRLVRSGEDAGVHQQDQRRAILAGGHRNKPDLGAAIARP